jgi:4-alpha-glucanotransferase
MAWSSPSALAIAPLQDVLNLGRESRMNVPGSAEGNWRWRFRADQLTPLIKERLADLTAIYSRWNGTPPARLDPHHLDTAASESKPSGDSRAETPLEAIETDASPRQDGPAAGKSAKPRKKRQEGVKTAGSKNNPAG